MFEILVYMIFILILLHISVLLLYNLIINPYEASTFIKYFPYHFLLNLYFSKNKTDKAYFSLRVDINTSKKNVRENNEGLVNLIKLANNYHISITFSIASEYISVLSNEAKKLIKASQHEIISHSHTHSDITEQNQITQVKNSKDQLEESFDKKVNGLIAPQAKHDFRTLKAAKENDIKYISAGSLSYIRYWSFPYPFRKKGISLIGGGIPSDYYLYHQKNKKPSEAVTIWKKAIEHRSQRKWFTQLEYHNFSTSKKELRTLEQLFRYIKEKGDLTPITQYEFIQRVLSEE